MKQRRLIETIEKDFAVLKRLVPVSIKNQYGIRFDGVLTSPGAAFELFRKVLSIDKEQKVVNITVVLLPYLIRDLDQAFKTAASEKAAYKAVYSLIYKINMYDEWRSAINIKPIVEILERNKKTLIKLTLQELKEFLKYEAPGHPTTIRIASVLRNLMTVVDWPELKTMYLSMHNVVFNNIKTVAAQRNYSAEENLVDYIWRNKVDLSLFPEIRKQIDLAKDKVLTNQIRTENSVFRGIGRTKFWLDILKEIGLDWLELDNVDAVYDLAKPFIITTILRSIKELKPGTYGWSELSRSVNLLISYEKLNWPELKVIKYSLEKGTLSP
jgi:hypothetical protein